MMGPAHIKAASGSCARGRARTQRCAVGVASEVQSVSPVSLLFQKVDINLHLRSDVTVRSSVLGLAAASCRKAWATCWSAKGMHLNVFTYRISIRWAHWHSGMPAPTMA